MQAVPLRLPFTTPEELTDAIFFLLLLQLYKYFIVLIQMHISEQMMESFLMHQAGFRIQIILLQKRAGIRKVWDMIITGFTIMISLTLTQLLVICVPL